MEVRNKGNEGNGGGQRIPKKKCRRNHSDALPEFALIWTRSACLKGAHLITSVVACWAATKDGSTESNIRCFSVSNTPSDLI